MRVTKAKLKAAKAALDKRLNELQRMNTMQLDAEVQRVTEYFGAKITGEPHQLAVWLCKDAVERSIPDSWWY